MLLVLKKKKNSMTKGQIPDFGYDIKMLSVVVDGEKSKTIPSRGMYKTQIDCSNGTRGYWDYNAWNLTLENVSENARCNITFTSNLTDAEYNQYIEAGKSLRRNTYRGKDITSYHNDGSLYEMISSGRFDDIYVGDYIIANNITWLVADIDNYLYSGWKEGTTAISLTKHHITLIPERLLILEENMNANNTTEGGYYNSKMKQNTLPSVLNTYVKPAFGNHVLTYNNLLTLGVDASRTSAGFGNSNSGASSDWSWYESQIDLMSEMNVYGGNIFSSSGYDSGLDNKQYALFQLKPEFIYSDKERNRMSYWLKNVSSTLTFSSVGGDGVAYNSSAAYSFQGVRPRFLIG